MSPRPCRPSAIAARIGGRQPTPALARLVATPAAALLAPILAAAAPAAARPAGTPTPPQPATRAVLPPHGLPASARTANERPARRRRLGTSFGWVDRGRAQGQDAPRLACGQLAGPALHEEPGGAAVPARARPPPARADQRGDSQ